MNEHENSRDELEDRWTDQALAEVVGGKRPPDLTARIMAAARPRRFVLHPRMKLALAASLLVTLGTIGAFAIAVHRTQRNWMAGIDFTGGVRDDIELDEGYAQVLRGSKDGNQSPDFPRKFDKLHAPIQEFARDMQRLRNARHRGFVDALNNTDTSHVPTAEEPALHYPDPKIWQMLTERRKKYKAVTSLERAGNSGAIAAEELIESRTALKHLDAALAAIINADLKVQNALSEQTELDFTDQPLSDVIDYLKNRHEIEIQLDDKVVADAGVGGNTNVTRNMKGITLRSALRLLLGELDLTFMVNSGVLMITSKSEAVRILQTRIDEGQGPGEGGDRYARIIENPFLDVFDNPLSTFSVDVDTASYAKARRYIEQANCLPPPDAVRIEEFVNYFSYDYAPPEGDVPFSAHVEVAACPWQPEHRLLRIGLAGKQIHADDRPAANLVFLLDVSGSMQPDDKLPRVRRAMQLLVEQLREQDQVAIVVYAAATGLVLPTTSGFQKEKIASALDSLAAGGSTNGGAGIRLAYDTAQASFIKGGTNRVILCTDGDFNVGTTSTAELERLVEERAKGSVFLTVLGFGMGNHNDEMMEKLADKGNGNYGYVDSEQEAHKLLVEQAGGTLVTIAKDVKLQLEFNPLTVGAYRLIGYEDRLLRAEDFNDDKKDAGEIGAGHTVTALYELVPAGKPVETPEVDELKYQRRAAPTAAASSGELLTLKLRYKDPDGQESHEPLVVVAGDAGHDFAQASADFHFASAVAGFGLVLRDSLFKGNLTYDAVVELAAGALGADPEGRRAEFVELVKKAKQVGGANAERPARNAER
jgi:Ca-activated chloride channel family protein